MKKFLPVFACLFLSLNLYTNDTYFYMASGQLVPTKEGNVDIEMKEEVINIVLNDSIYEVTVDFSFFNNGPETSLEIGFPFFCQGISCEGTISDFRCWTNGVETSFADYPIEKEWSSWEISDLENAYVRTIDFPSKKITKTKITYKSTYGRESPSYLLAKYLYGTGSSWKNSIGKMTIRIQNYMEFNYPGTITYPKAESVKRINENTWEIVCRNIEPEKYTDCITLELGNVLVTQDQW